MSVVVLTPQEAIDELIDDVQAPLDDGTLKKGPGKALQVILHIALWKLHHGKPRLAKSLLRVFVSLIHVYVRVGLTMVRYARAVGKKIVVALVDEE